MRNIRPVAMAFSLAALVFASVGVLAPLSVAAAPCATTVSAGKTTLTFCFTGANQTWVVPANVTSAKFSVSGAQGGAGSGSPALGGLGGRAVATLAVTPGSTITIVVGGPGVTPPNPDGCPTVAGGAGGFNGGAAGGAAGANSGSCGGSGGGGASDVRIGGSSLANRMLVGGGGGGASPNAASDGGAGGGATGGTGGDGGGGVNLGGGGGTQGAGGTGGTGSSAPLNGGAGTVGLGGGGATNTSSGVGAGGGGGGWRGGGGGGAEDDSSGGGGGGGSAHGPAGAVLTSGVRAGAGIVTVTFAPVLPAASASQPPIPWLPIGGLVVGLAVIFFGLRRRRASV